MTKTKILIDMDGVLVNFYKGACELHKVDDPYKHEKHWGNWEIAEVFGMTRDEFFRNMEEDFWVNLEPTPECFQIIEAMERIVGIDNICILTAPTKNYGCAPGKIKWLEKNLPKYSRRFLIGQFKEFCAHPEAILIDDADKNVKKFRQHFSYAYLVPRPWNSKHKETFSLDELAKFAKVIIKYNALCDY